jgi:hypothetical protein
MACCPTRSGRPRRGRGRRADAPTQGPAEAPCLRNAAGQAADYHVVRRTAQRAEWRELHGPHARAPPPPPLCVAGRSRRAAHARRTGRTAIGISMVVFFTLNIPFLPADTPPSSLSLRCARRGGPAVSALTETRQVGVPGRVPLRVRRRLPHLSAPVAHESGASRRAGEAGPRSRPRVTCATRSEPRRRRPRGRRGRVQGRACLHATGVGISLDALARARSLTSRIASTAASTRTRTPSIASFATRSRPPPRHAALHADATRSSVWRASITIVCTSTRASGRRTTGCSSPPSRFFPCSLPFRCRGRAARPRHNRGTALITRGRAARDDGPHLHQARRRRLQRAHRGGAARPAPRGLLRFAWAEPHTRSLSLATAPRTCRHWRCCR